MSVYTKNLLITVKTKDYKKKIIYIIINMKVNFKMNTCMFDVLILSLITCCILQLRFSFCLDFIQLSNWYILFLLKPRKTVFNSSQISCGFHLHFARFWRGSHSQKSEKNPKNSWDSPKCHLMSPSPIRYEPIRSYLKNFAVPVEKWCPKGGERSSTISSGTSKAVLGKKWDNYFVRTKS